MSLRLRSLPVLALMMALSPALVRGQGFIVDSRPHVPIVRSFEVREVSVDARLRDQVAEVQVSQTFYNPGSFVLESEYLFPIPDDAAVQNFVLLVDGKELPGRLLPKDEARRVYENIVRTKRDPALLEYMGRGLYRTNVFPIPPGAERRVTLRYTQVCRRDKDVVEFSYPFGTQKFTAKPIRHLSLRVGLDSREAIKSIYSPSHDARVERSGEHSATVRIDQHDVIPSTDFRLVYTLSEGSLGAGVISYRPSDGDDGYFLLLASPQVKAADAKPLPKTVIFVLDRSGSMTGKKIEQARNALKFVLENLRDDDTFNIIAYDDRVDTFKPELQRYSRDSRSEAVRYVENVQPGGSTNIDEALKAALGMIRDDSRPSYVLFLTDGLPTAGETRETAIADRAKESNRNHARVFSFGVGYDVNARLLDRISGGNGGTSEYVKPDQDIEASVSRFYSKLTRPALTALSITMKGTDLNRTYPRDLPDLFEGGQLVWVGRYRQSGNTTVRVEGKVAGDRQTLEFPADLAEAGRGSQYDFVEKLWAVRRVGFLIDQIDLHGQNKELTDELVRLSTKYGILTPYTSFLADENVHLHAFRDNEMRALHELEGLKKEDGALGVNQRLAKGRYERADNCARSSMPPRRHAAARPSAGQPPGTEPWRCPADSVARPTGPRVLHGRRLEAGLELGWRRDAAMPGQYSKAVDAEGHERRSRTNVPPGIGKKTFYRKGERWVDSTVKPDDEAKATVVEQFSDAYFELARKQGADLNQYLTFEEPVTVDLGGKVYRIERAKK